MAVWRCDDWSVVAAVRAPYAKLVTSTFSTRMSWSPDGSFLATGGWAAWAAWAFAGAGGVVGWEKQGAGTVEDCSL